MATEFEFDPEKSKINAQKHGVDFIKAQEIWQGPYAEFAALSEYENRYAAVGKIGKNIYTCIFCLRKDNIRLISCRRARKGEVTLYEKTIKKTNK